MSIALLSHYMSVYVCEVRVAERAGLGETGSSSTAICVGSRGKEGRGKVGAVGERTGGRGWAVSVTVGARGEGGCRV
jgi:hypothetical protein